MFFITINQRSSVWMNLHVYWSALLKLRIWNMVTFRVATYKLTTHATTSHKIIRSKLTVIVPDNNISMMKLCSWIFLYFLLLLQKMHIRRTVYLVITRKNFNHHYYTVNKLSVFLPVFRSTFKSYTKNYLNECIKYFTIYSYTR